MLRLFLQFSQRLYLALHLSNLPQSRLQGARTRKSLHPRYNQPNHPAKQLRSLHRSPHGTSRHRRCKGRNKG